MRLEPILHAALRVATGLPRWTPIPILRREARSLSVFRSHDLRRGRFFLKHFALGLQSPLPVLDDQLPTQASSFVGDLLSRCQVGRDHLLSWFFPPVPSGTVDFALDTLGFQDKKLHPTLINQLFHDYISTCDGWHMLATDASKSESHTGMAVWDMTQGHGFSSKASEVISVFSAEALAIGLALDKGPSQGKLIIFSDSRSVISSLKSITFRSPTVILHLHRRLCLASIGLSEIRLVWVPGHVGIAGNERADFLARYLGWPAAPTLWVPPEDVSNHMCKLFWTEETTEWILGKYCNDFPHLSKRSWEHRKLRLPRRGEVLLSRLRTRTLPTQALMFKLHLSASPLCPSCNVPDTCDHFLLTCGRYQHAREILYRDLGISGSSPTLSSLCDLSVDGVKYARKLVSFLLRSDRF